MKDSITVKAYCKINISLDIKGLREDGKHEVDMILQTIPLYDLITIKKRKEANGGIHIESNASWVPKDNKNTAFKAAELLLKDFLNNEESVDIYIDKKVPPCGGLGGSSSDAAGVLLGMNELFELGLNLQELQNYGAQIGADVPFLLKYGAAIATGTGTDLQYIQPLKEGILLLVNSGAEVSTALAYRLYDTIEQDGGIPKEAHVDAAEVAKAMACGLAATVPKMKNVLEYPAFSMRPELELIKGELLKAGAAATMMSGSGGSVFGIFYPKDADKAYEMSKELEGRGWFTFVCDFDK